MISKNINTYNESSLHNTLKLLYSENSHGQTEIEENGFIYDIVTESSDIIEIQTKNLSKLLPKIMATLDCGKKIRVVYPLVITKRIVLYSKDGKILSNRKSPKKNSIYDLFDELTGIYPVLLNKNFTLEVLEISLIEERIKTEEAVNSKNQRRRFKKDWIKSNKRLEEILNTRIFSSKEDYLDLLPVDLPGIFCAKDLENCLRNKNYPQNAYKNAHLILWVLSRMELIELSEKPEAAPKTRARYYRIK